IESSGARSSARRSAHLLVAHHLLAAGRIAARFRLRAALILLLLFAAMARHPALAPCLPRFLARPLVRRSLLMGSFAALARDLSLFVPIHRRKSAVLFCHRALLPGSYASGSPPVFTCRASNTRAATDVPRWKVSLSNKTT